MSLINGQFSSAFEKTLLEAPKFAMDDIAIGGTVIYKTLQGYYKISKARSKRDPFTVLLQNGDTIQNNAIVSTDASDWSKYKDKKVVKEGSKAAVGRRGEAPYLKAVAGEKTFNTYADWKSAVKKECPDAVFKGSSRSASAHEPEAGIQIAEWDGTMGVIFKNWNESLDSLAKSRSTSVFRESAELAKKLVRGEKSPRGFMAKLDHWFSKLIVTKDANRFEPAEIAVKALKSYGFSGHQIHSIREAAAEAAQTAIERMQKKYGDRVPAKYISKLSSSFAVFDLYLNISEEIHREFAELMRKLFDAKIDKIKDQLNLVKEDENLQTLGKHLSSKASKSAVSSNDISQSNNINKTTDPTNTEAKEAGSAQFQVGDVVIPTVGPHKGDKHEVTGIMDDGRVTIAPVGLNPADIKYSQAKKQGLIEPRLLKKATKDVLVGQSTTPTESLLAAVGALLDKDGLFEAVAGPFKRFKKGQVVTVIKTGKKVKVLSQNDIGLVQTVSMDPNDLKIKSWRDYSAATLKKGLIPGAGHQEYMPKELQEDREINE